MNNKKIIYHLNYHTMSKPRIILYKSKKLADGKTHPVMLYLFIGKDYVVSLGYSCTPEQWNAKQGRFNKKMENFEEKNNVLWQKEIIADKIIQELALSEKPFSIEEFKERFAGKKKTITIAEFLDVKIHELEVEGSIGNRNRYVQIKSMLHNYKHTNNTLFTDVDYNFLKGFETYILSRPTTTKKSNAYFYMRMLRATFNEAVRRGYVNEKLYPFKTQFNKNGFSIAHLNGDFNPRPLSLEEFERLVNFNVASYPKLAKSYHYFMLLIEARGLNFSDLCELTDESMNNGRITYIRKKTGKSYNIPVSEKMLQTINTYKGKKYIYSPMEKASKDPKKRNVYVRNQLRLFNRDLETISVILALDTKITSYTARYTYTNVLIQRHIPVPYIQQALGHSNIATTQHYIKKFSNEEVDKVVNVF
jgi:integrase/recombinase XerD